MRTSVGSPAVVAEPAPDELARGGLLLLGVHRAECLGRELVVDALAAQLDTERPAGEPPVGVAGPDEDPGVLRVVDKTDLGEPVEHAVGDLLGDVASRHRLGELRPAARRTGEQPQRDGPGDGLGVRLGVDGRRTRGRRLGGRRAAAGPARRATRRPVDHRADDRVVVGDPVVVRRTGGHRAQKSTTGPASAGASSLAPTPSFSLIFFSSSSARSGLSRRNARAFSLPWPSWSPS